MKENEEEEGLREEGIKGKARDCSEKEKRWNTNYCITAMEFSLLCRTADSR